MQPANGYGKIHVTVTEVITIPRKIVPPKREGAHREISALIYETITDSLLMAN